MNICRAEILNFRALKKVDVPLNNFSVLLGENDVGKTSFLFALERFFTNKKATEKEDFFCEKTDSDISITLTFENLPSAPELAAIKHADGKIVVRKVFAFDKTPEVKAVMKDGSTKSIDKEILKDYFSSESFHFIPVHRDLSVQFSMNKTALLGKTMRAKMHEAIKGNDPDNSLPKIEEILRKSLEEPKDTLQSFLRQQMSNEDLKLLFDELTVDPIEGVSFKVKLSDDRVENVLISNRGAGTQNNLIIALFRLIAGLDVGGKIIFAMEEPENSLHPKAQRQLLTVLQEISKDSQVIVTTHSPVFLERSKFENNIILTRTIGGNTIAKTFNPLMLEELRTDLGIRPSDALLKGGGNCAILVEGNTEEDGFPILMEMLGLSEFKLGIAIISLRGSDLHTIRSTAKLLLAYDIPCVVVLDKDAQKQATDIERESGAELKNIKKVFCLKEGTIEDYYPLEIVAEVINENLSPREKVVASDFNVSKHGAERLKDFNKVMFAKGAGDPGTYLKRLIGSVGTIKMKERGLEVPPELKAIFDEVVKIVNEPQ